MKRSVRNGIAIAGMAGGMWFLGHAVADADTGQAATAGNTSTTANNSSSNDSTNVAKAENNNSTSVSTGDIKGGNGGSNTAVINTGVEPQPAIPVQGGTASANSAPSGGGGGGGGGSVNVTTGNVSVSQQANGGSVSGSGNVHVNGSVSQSASAHNDVSQTSSSSGDQRHDGNQQDSVSSNSQSGGDNRGGNDSTNIAKAENNNSTDVYTGDIKGGRGGENFTEVNTGLIVVPETIWTPTLSGTEQVRRDEHGKIHVRATTGSVWVRQEANGGNVSGSGNVDVTGNVHQSASASNDVTQTSTSADRRKHHDDRWSEDGQKSLASNDERGGNRGDGNDSKNIAIARNNNETTVYTGDIKGGRGGSNEADINTGLVVFSSPYNMLSSNENNGGRKHIDVTVSTGDVWLSQEANGGDVSGSGNVSVCTTADQSASASNDVTQNSSSTGDKGKRADGNDSKNVAVAKNNNSTDVYTGDIKGGRGGYNTAEVNTGAIIQPEQYLVEASTLSSNQNEGRKHHDDISVTVSTGDVWLSQEANGGNVSGSGNVSVNNSANQSAWANNDVTQNSSSKGDKGKRGDGNDGKNIAIARNNNETTVDTGDIKGGRGGDNFADVNTGLITDGFFGKLPSSLDVTTGDVWVSQEANGGDVTGSGNVSVGNKGSQCGCQHAAPTPATPAAPVAVKTVATKTAVVVLSSVQPTSTLATTGADTSAPLTAGLLALGAGAALTLAGRRRREEQAA